MEANSTIPSHPYFHTNPTMQPNQSTFIACDATYEDAGVVLFGAPFDGTTSYRPGTRFGPQAIRSESIGLETYSPYQQKDLTDQSILDIGDLNVGYGNPGKALDVITHTTKQLLADGKLPFLLGGEHLVTLGSVRAMVETYPDLRIIHFDAHADLADTFSDELLSHATVLRRCYDLVGDGRIHQFGIRSMSKEEDEWAPGHVAMNKFNLNGVEACVNALKENNCPVYLTVDLDVLDPSVFPGTGTPEAGGVTFMELLGALKQVTQLNIVGCDVNELSPHYDPSGVSTAVACKIVRELLLLLAEEK